MSDIFDKQFIEAIGEWATQMAQEELVRMNLLSPEERAREEAEWHRLLAKIDATEKKDASGNREA